MEDKPSGKNAKSHAREHGDEEKHSCANAWKQSHANEEKQSPSNEKKNDFRPILLQIGISIILLCALLYFADFPSVVSSLASGKLEFFLAASFAYLAINLIMTYRITALLGAMGTPVNFLQALRCHYLGMLASDFTPARSGYFAAAFALHRHGPPVSKAVSSILAPQMFDFFIKVFASVVGVAYLVSMLGMGGSSILMIAAAIAVIMGFVAVIAVILFYPKIAEPHLPHLKRIPFGSKIYVMLSKLSENAPIMRANLLIVISLLFVTWSLKGFEWWMLAEAIGISPNIPFHLFLFFLFLQPAVTVLQFIPTPTPAGAGVSEAGTVGILLLFGISAPSAVAFGILTRAVMLVQDWVGVSEWRGLNLHFLDETRW